MTRVQLDKIIKIASREDRPLVVMPLVDYESLLATLEEAADPGALKALRESDEDVKAGRVYSLEEVFGRSYDKDNRRRAGQKGFRKNKQS